MCDFESVGKRQKFRLQIRNKQIQQKLSRIRQNYTQLQQSSNNYGTRWGGEEYENKIWHTVAALKDFMKQADTYRRANNYRMIGQKLSEVSHKVEQITQSAMLEAGNQRLDAKQAKCWNIDRQILSISINKVVEADGQLMMKILKMEGNLQQYFGEDEEDQKCQWTEEEQDKKYRQLCQKDRLGSIFEFDQYTAEETPLYQHLAKEVQNKQQLDPIPYLAQLLLAQKVMKLLSQLLPEFLILSSSIQVVTIAWEAHRLLPAPPSDPPTIEDQYHQELYLDFMQSMVSLFNTFSDNGASYRQPMRDVLVELGVFEEMRYIIEYVVSCGKNKKNANETFMKNMIQLHTSLLELIQKYQVELMKEEAKDLTQNLLQHFTSYCLYIISLPLVGNHSHAVSRLYYNTLCLLCHILVLDIQLSACMDVSPYQNMLNIMQVYAEGQWNEEAECIVAGVLKVIELVADGCEIVGGQLVGLCSVLDYLEAVVNRIVGLIEGEYMNSYANPESIQAILKLLGHILRNLLKTSSKSRKKQLFAHKIWENLFRLMEKHGNRLIPLYSIFPNYFLCFGAKITLSHLYILLENCSRLELSRYDPQYKQVNELLYEVYSNSECYLNEQQMLRVSNLYQMYGVEGIQEWASWE